MIKTAFDAQRFKWQRNTVDQLPKHDLFFGTPVNTAFAGFPICNPIPIQSYNDSKRAPFFLCFCGTYFDPRCGAPAEHLKRPPVTATCEKEIASKKRDAL